MKKTAFILAVCAMLSMHSGIALDLNLYNVGSGKRPSIALNQDGYPHVAYLTEHVGGSIYHSLIVNPDIDIPVDVVNVGYFYGPVDMELNSQDEVHIIYHDHDAFGGAPGITSYKNGAWSTSQINHPGHDGWDVEILFDADDKARVAYVDPPIFGTGNGIEYAFETDSNWVVEPLGTRAVGTYGYGLGFAIDTVGEPRISFYEDSASQLFLATRDNGVWTMEVVDSSMNSGRFSQIHIDESNELNVFYTQVLGTDTAVIKHAQKVGGIWEIDVIDTIPDISVGIARKSLAMQKHGDNFELMYTSTKLLYHYIVADTGLVGGSVNLQSLQPEITLGQTVDFSIDAFGFYHIAIDLQSEGMVAYLTDKTGFDGVEEQVFEKNLQLYPNPSDEFLQVNSAEVGTLQVYSMGGEQVLTVDHFGASQLNISTLTPGVYTLQLVTTGGIITERFVKK